MGLLFSLCPVEKSRLISLRSTFGNKAIVRMLNQTVDTESGFLKK